MHETLDPVTRHHIDQAADRLAEEFAGVFSQETIARYMAESTDLLGEAKINVFVPVLAHRFARERLKALAQAEGIVDKEQPEVLFVCVHNAGRSQMAAGLLKLRSKGRINVRSAGSSPEDEINPNAVIALEELGVDMNDVIPNFKTEGRILYHDIDLQSRNIDPVSVRRRIGMFDALLSDNTNSWELNGDGTWRRLRPKKDDRRISAQALLMRNAVARARRTVSRRS